MNPMKKRNKKNKKTVPVDATVAVSIEPDFVQEQPVVDDKPRDIGSNWLEYLDEGSGDLYYSNSVTEVTQWVWPDEVPNNT